MVTVDFELPAHFSVESPVRKAFLSAIRADLLRLLFTMRHTPKRGLQVSFNSEAVSQHISRYAGFQALLSNGIKDPVEAMRVYRDKDAVEKCFDDLKNSLDMKRLRMHTSATVDELTSHCAMKDGGQLVSHPYIFFGARIVFMDDWI